MIDTAISERVPLFSFDAVATSLHSALRSPIIPVALILQDCIEHHGHSLRPKYKYNDLNAFSRLAI